MAVRTSSLVALALATALAVGAAWDLRYTAGPRSPTSDHPPDTSAPVLDRAGPTAEDEDVASVGAVVRLPISPGSRLRGSRTARSAPTAARPPHPSVAERPAPVPPRERPDQHSQGSFVPAASAAPPDREQSAVGTPPLPPAGRATDTTGSAAGGDARQAAGDSTSASALGTPGPTVTTPSTVARLHAPPAEAVPGPSRMTPPRVISLVGMGYPGEAFRLTVRRRDLGSGLTVVGAEGTVALRALVLADGTVRDVEIVSSSGSAVLDRTAAGAALRWRFAPAARDGVPIDAYVTLKIRYVVR